MKIALVNPPNNFFDICDLAPPLGLTYLKNIANSLNYECEIFDFNLTEIKSQKKQSVEEWIEEKTGLILQFEPKIVCFTSMALDSHVSLELAMKVKESCPEIITVLGGPHFSSIATEIIQHYKWIDFIVSGEGEEAFSVLLSRLSSGNLPYQEKILKYSVSSLPNKIIYDKLALQKYFQVNKNNLLLYECERGCKYNCAFCYSKYHWGKKIKIKKIDQIIADFNYFVDLGAKEIFVVNDNFFNDPNLAKEILKEMYESRLNIKWRCYSTIRDIDQDSINLLSKANCTDIFFGIDAISEYSKKTFNKVFFRDNLTVTKKLKEMIENGIQPTCAFLLETCELEKHNDSLSETLDFAAICSSLGCKIRINTISLYPNTPLYRKIPQADFYYCEYKSKILFDAHPLLVENKLAQKYPWLFPFHSNYTNPNNYLNLLLMSHAAFTIIQLFPDTYLKLREHFECGDILMNSSLPFDLYLNTPPQKRREAELLKFFDTVYRESNIRADFVFKNELVNFL